MSYPPGRKSGSSTLDSATFSRIEEERSQFESDQEYIKFLTWQKRYDDLELFEYYRASKRVRNPSPISAGPTFVAVNSKPPQITRVAVKSEKEIDNRLSLNDIENFLMTGEFDGIPELEEIPPEEDLPDLETITYDERETPPAIPAAILPAAPLDPLQSFLAREFRSHLEPFEKHVIPPPPPVKNFVPELATVKRRLTYFPALPAPQVRLTENVTRRTHQSTTMMSRLQSYRTTSNNLLTSDSKWIELDNSFKRNPSLRKVYRVLTRNLDTGYIMYTAIMLSRGPITLPSNPANNSTSYHLSLEEPSVKNLDIEAYFVKRLIPWMLDSGVQLSDVVKVKDE